MARSHAESSALAAEIRGDTGAPAFATRDRSVSPAIPPVSPEPSRERRRISKRRRAKTLFRRWKTFSLRNTWFNPLALVVLILSAYAFNPTESNSLHAALFLSYRLDQHHHDAQYGKGPRDLAFVAFYVVVISFVREFLMQVVLRPLGIRKGIKSRSKLSRFMEQMYTVAYFAVFGPFGLYVMSRTPVWYFRTAAFFEGYPHLTHDALFKSYYLLQAAYWAQQAIVLILQLEKPRSDFKELVGHHIVTLTLIWLSYRFHFTYIGLAVYITHDISDFFLASSKSLSYVESSIVGPYFALFVFVWIYLRHYINLRILWSVLTEFSVVGPYELDWEGQIYKFWASQVITFVLLASLQCVNLFWLFMILRIAKRYVFTNVAADDRSEAEDDDELDESTSGLALNGGISKVSAGMANSMSQNGGTEGQSAVQQPEDQVKLMAGKKDS